MDGPLVTLPQAVGEKWETSDMLLVTLSLTPGMLAELNSLLSETQTLAKTLFVSTHIVLYRLGSGAVLGQGFSTEDRTESVLVVPCHVHGYSGLEATSASAGYCGKAAL